MGFEENIGFWFPLVNISTSSPTFKLDLSIGEDNLFELLSNISYLALVLYIKEFAKISFQFERLFSILSPKFFIVIISPSPTLKSSFFSFISSITPRIIISTFLLRSPFS